jgi:DNA-binding Lrp family transcriptional regulator
LVTGFVLINTELGAEIEVLKDLKEIPAVKETYSVYGVYDIVARIEAESMKEIKEVISMKVRQLNKISSTLTMIVV